MSETLKNLLKREKWEAALNIINVTANTKQAMDGQTWGKLNRIALVVFENLLG